VSRQAEKRDLGLTGLSISALTLGGGPLGSMPENFGYEVAESQAVELVRAVLDSELRAIDTANGYSSGRSEERIGRAIAEYGGLPDDYLVMTKVDAKDGDYSEQRVRDSLRESAARLGIGEPLPVVFLHDPEFFDFEEMTRAGGAVDALLRARDDGLVSHIGLAGGDVHVMERYLDLGVFEVLLVHNRWTLVDRSASHIIDLARDQGAGVVNAAVLGGGILADTTGRSASYGYRPASEVTLRAIGAMRDVCARWGTDLGSAAVRFSTRDTRIATTIVGVSKPARLESTVAASELDLPEAFWNELEALLPSPENWLDYATATTKKED
jgi:D-threo-aldose 1-dehydrogenase